MKKLIKYRRLCAILLLIVLISSNAHVCAKIVDEPSSVPGSGTSADPYIISVSGGPGSKVVLKPEKVPFYFKVTGTGGVGGVFAIDYDISSGLVSFCITNTVNFNKNADYVYSEYGFESEDIGVNLAGKTDFSISVENTNYLNNLYQLGITARGVEEIELPKYKITEEYTQIFPSDKSNSSPYPKGCLSNWSDTYSTATRSMELTNVNSDITTGASSSKSDLYFFAKNIETEDDLKSFYAASGYQYTENEGSAYECWNFVDVIMDSSLHTQNISISKEGEITDSVTLVYKFEGLNNTALDEQGNEVSSVEQIISRVFMAFGDILLYMIQVIFGKKLTIDALIFNKYDDTKLSFYSKSSNDISKAVASVVNTWYGIFSKLAYLLYVVVLVYIGVMILVTAGTGDQDKRKKSLGDWFAGLAIMFAVPTFVIPSLIKLNDAFVEFMYNKSTERINTYYNYYDSEGDILGGDSATLSIDELITKKGETEDELGTTEEDKEKKLEEINSMLDDLDVDNIELAKECFGKDMYEKYKYYREWNSAEYALAYAVAGMQNGILTTAFSNNSITLEEYNTIYSFACNLASDSWYEKLENFGKERYRLGDDGNYHYSYMGYTSELPMYDNLDLTENMKQLGTIYEEIYTLETTIDTIESLIEIKQTDLMTIMRDYAGKYTRMVFVVVWFLLIFQMVAMIFIYYKRIFVIAVLIAIFPLVMIFYCIDKMADGSAQTLSMWFKELISDIFIQSIHCVMYVVLVQMGLEIYRNDSNNWFLFLAAMLMLVPAERMMKEIFGLNSGSLGQLGGMGMNIAMGIGAAVKLGKMGAKGAGNFLMR